jgi:GNAT superfamily N-acetyltransferase
VELGGTAVGKGGILFHYNRPYGDIWMDVEPAHRRRGLGGWLVQELKRECYELGAVPAARCNPENVASRQTLQKAGFVPCGHILIGSLG